LKSRSALYVIVIWKEEKQKQIQQIFHRDFRVAYLFYLADSKCTLLSCTGAHRHGTTTTDEIKS
ncbi:MAG: hypothetical protein ACK55Z_00945, partial [bacterium]